MATAAKNLVEVTTPTPDGSVGAQAQAALDRVRAVVINSSGSYVAAAADLAKVKGQWETVEAQRVELKAPLLEGGRRVDAFFKAPLQFLVDAESILKGKISAYDKQQEEIRKEEQRKADEAARVEREKKEAEAREIQRKADEKAAADRKAAEAQRQAEETKRREADDARRRGDAEAAAEADRAARTAAASASKLETRATNTETKAQEKAATVQASAAAIVAPVVQRSVPVVAGMSKRKKWAFKVVDASLVPNEYKVVDEAKIRGVVNALGDQAKIPGVQIFPDTTLASVSR